MSGSLRDKIEEIKIQEIISSEKEFEFPEFIRCLRKAQGITRKRMASELGINEMMIYYKEEGKFTRMPEVNFIASISKYLGVSKSLLVSKARTYVENKK